MTLLRTGVAQCSLSLSIPPKSSLISAQKEPKRASEGWVSRRQEKPLSGRHNKTSIKSRLYSFYKIKNFFFLLIIHISEKSFLPSDHKKKTKHNKTQSKNNPPPHPFPSFRQNKKEKTPSPQTQPQTSGSTSLTPQPKKNPH